MDLHKLSLGTLVPEGPIDVCFIQQGISVVFCWYSDLISHIHTYTHTHKDTQRHTTHSEAIRLTHPYNYQFAPPIMCSQQLSISH